MSIDPIIAAFDELPNSQLLTAKQLALIMSETEIALKHRRSRGEPPPWKSTGANKIRYEVGEYRKWVLGLDQGNTLKARKEKKDAILGLDEPIQKGGNRSKQTTFQDFIATGKAKDEWPIAHVGMNKHPIDFFQSLRMDLDDSDDCSWITLEQYLIDLKRSLQQTVNIQSRDTI